MDPSSLTINALLSHHGVKGMHWGIRKEDSPGTNRLAVPTLKIDPSLAKSTQIAGRRVSTLMAQRYGYHISELKGMNPEEESANPGIVGFVRNTPGKSEGVVEIIRPDLKRMLASGENIGWFGEGTGTTTALITHEAAHALFHADQQVVKGTGTFGGSKKTNASQEARDKALKASVKRANKDGIPPHLFGAKLSGYSEAAMMREETEAELFSQYHWSPNPKPFVKTWGEILHKELGLDPTPFREVVHSG